MKTLNELFNESTSKFLKSLQLIIVFSFVVYLALSIFELKGEQARISSYVRNVFVNNTQSSAEEEKTLGLIKNFNNSFDLSIAEMKNSDFCGPINCYSISYKKLYSSYVTEIILFLCLFGMIQFLSRFITKKRENSLKEQFNLISKILKEKNYTGDASLTKELQEVLSLVKSREEDLKYIYNAKTIAHDIRSPLTLLEMISEELEALPDSAKELALGAIERINEIADRLSNNGYKLSNQIDVSTLLERIIKEKVVEHKDKNIELRLKDETNKNAKIAIDETELARSLSNLINNSIEAMGKAGGIVTINVANKNNKLEIKITDSGSGFPQQMLNKEIIQGNTIGKENGQGLGLFHSHKTVIENKGEFLFYNHDNGGACIEIQFPLSH